jgi:hypothetical protein
MERLNDSNTTAEYPVAETSLLVVLGVVPVKIVSALANSWHLKFNQLWPHSSISRICETAEIRCIERTIEFVGMDSNDHSRNLLTAQLCCACEGL